MKYMPYNLILGLPGKKKEILFSGREYSYKRGDILPETKKSSIRDAAPGVPISGNCLAQPCRLRQADWNGEQGNDAGQKMYVGKYEKKKLLNKSGSLHFLFQSTSQLIGQLIYPFIEVRNSALSFVPFIFFNKVFKASSGFMSAICLRNTHIR